MDPRENRADSHDVQGRRRRNDRHAGGNEAMTSRSNIVRLRLIGLQGPHEDEISNCREHCTQGLDDDTEFSLENSIVAFYQGVRRCIAKLGAGDCSKKTADECYRGSISFPVSTSDSAYLRHRSTRFLMRCDCKEVPPRSEPECTQEFHRIPFSFVST